MPARQRRSLRILRCRGRLCPGFRSPVSQRVGAYIEETPSTLEEYLGLYQAQGTVLRAARSDLAPDHASVRITFALAFKQVAERSQAAADLISACSCLAPDAIPEEIFTEGAVALGEVISTAVTGLAQFARCLREATRYSLIERQPAQRTLEMHRVVQSVLRDEMGHAGHRQWTERVVRALNTVFPDVDVTNWARCERLVAHAQACAGHIAAGGFQFPEAAALLNRAGCYLYQRARYAEAEPLLQRSVAIREQPLGPQHPDLATSLNNLAGLYHAQGQYGKAEPLYQRALAIREQALGPRHPDVATSLNNLAGLYHAQGQYGEGRAAIPALARDSGAGPGAPTSRRGHGPQQPGGALHDTGPIRRPPSRSISTRSPFWNRPWAPNIPTWPRASITWRCSTRRRASTERPSRSISAHWPSMRKLLAQNIPMWLPTSTTWRGSTTTMAGTGRPSRSTTARSRFWNRPWAPNIPAWRQFWKTTPPYSEKHTAMPKRWPWSPVPRPYELTTRRAMQRAESDTQTRLRCGPGRGR